VTAIKPCGRSGCRAPATTAGYCEHDYRLRLHTGRGGFRDPAPARAHVALLRELGWTWQQIADAAQLANSVAHGLSLGRYKRLRLASEQALLSVPLVPRESHRSTGATGTRRRVQALAWMGWSGAEVSHRAGVSPATLQTEIYRGRLSVRLAARVRAVYGELSGIRGPSSMAAAKARRMGFAPPAAWDDGAIDDPQARPLGVRKQQAAESDRQGAASHAA
jgi:lambda repressor-like predicted transcriptional regulator